MKPHQLELGASAVPHFKTTHAIDRDSKSKTIKEADTLYREEGATTKEKFERRLKTMNYKFGFNYNTQRFPWPNNSFKVVYSKASLGNYGNPSHAFKESYRVLKSGGVLKFDIIGTEKYLLKIKRMLLDIGFTSVKMKSDGIPYIYKGLTKYGAKITAIKNQK